MTMHHQNDPPALIAVDWGTSRFRAWMMTKKGVLLSESHGPEGMLHCKSTGFEPVLRRHLKTLGAPERLPVLICGMAGARQGWIEAPYLQAPTPLDDLHKGAVRVPVDGEVRILPGVAQRDRERPDVMRGEETQILGVIRPESPGLICIPGTHSKWITLSKGALSAFTTYMTGEVFEILSCHSILRHAIDGPLEVSAKDEAFHTGLTQAIKQNIGLTALLFRLRASQLLGFSELSSGVGYLSGMLIGSELADVSRRFAKGGSVHLIASGKLAKLYEAALTNYGFHVSLVDAETASRQGILKAAQRIWPLEV